MKSQLQRLKDACDKNNHRLLSVKFGLGIIEVLAQDLSYGIEPIFEHVRDEIDYTLLYNAWVDMGTRTISHGTNISKVINQAIDYFRPEKS